VGALLEFSFACSLTAAKAGEENVPKSKIANNEKIIPTLFNLSSSLIKITIIL
jgi:hypothetical protein